eukprot:7599252-Alexandrium_andersonii.AAC.1
MQSTQDRWPLFAKAVRAWLQKHGAAASGVMARSRSNVPSTSVAAARRRLRMKMPAPPDRGPR